MPEDFDLKVDVNGALRGEGAAPIDQPPASKIGASKRRRAPGEAAGTRKEHDTYDTPPELALACCKWLQERIVGFYPSEGEKRLRVLDPTAGGGPFVAAADVAWPGAKIAAVDIRPECAASYAGARAKFVCTNALTLPPELISQVDLIISNYPFKLADALVRHLWASMKPGAVMASILNVTFLGSEERWRGPGGIFFVSPLSYVVPIVPRPSFLKIDGESTSPKFEAALFVWKKFSDEDCDAADLAGADLHSTVIPREPIRWEKPAKPRKKK